MEREFMRIPLTVDVLCMPDGSFKPQKLFYHGAAFEITRVLGVRAKCPTQVGCIAPIEYTVMIDNAARKIYYEHDTNTWFSVKEVCKA